MALHAAARAAALVRAAPPGARWFLACDTDADGLCAAAVASAALRRAGQHVQVRASRGKAAADHEATLAEEAHGVILLDKGSSHVALFAAHHEATGRPVILLDHHNIDAAAAAALPAGVVAVNPRLEGMDGSRDASSATVAVAFALALHGDDALAWGPIGLSGAIGDWQHVPSWQGFNKDLLDRCLEAGHVRRQAMPDLIGVDLASAVAQHEPPVPGLQDAAACRGFLEQLGFDPVGEAEDLDREEQTRLVSALAERFITDGDPAHVPTLVRQAHWNVRLGTSLRHVYRIADACGRLGHAGTGVAFLLGDAAAATEAKRHFAAYKNALAAALDALRSEGPDVRGACQVHWTQRPELTGMVAGLGVEHVLADTSRPLVVLARREDQLVQASTRGTHALTDAGLDLGAALHAAAGMVGREGGGHPIAAGTVLGAEEVDAFLDALDEALAEQGFLQAS